MRKILISILLAGTAITPAVAQRADDGPRSARAERQQMREQRQQVREDRSTRSERSDDAREQRVRAADQPRIARSPAVESQQTAQQPQSRVRLSDWGTQGRAQPTQGSMDAFRARNAARVARQVQQSDQAGSGRQRIERMRQDGLREQSRPLPNVLRNRVPVVSNQPREGTQPPLRAERSHRDRVQWNTDWRRDHRHDWRNYRDRHRSTFRLGLYYDPFGWGYRPYSIGWRMWPSYYGSRYWINDPWQYRLPYAPAGYRWVRYWDDAVLVDTWSGQVVDVIHNFFW